MLFCFQYITDDGIPFMTAEYKILEDASKWFVCEAEHNSIMWKWENNLVMLL